MVVSKKKGKYVLTKANHKCARKCKSKKKGKYILTRATHHYSQNTQNARRR